MREITDRKVSEKWQRAFSVEHYFGMDMRPYTRLLLFDSEEAILQEGENAEVLYFLLEGRVKLYVSQANGKTTLVNFAEGPCFLGEMELLGAREQPIGVEAVMPCTCYGIYLPPCKEKLLNNVTFLHVLCRFLAERSVGNTSRYTKNQSGKLEQRMADFLLFASYNGVYRERHTEAADFLGISYRHFLYVLAKLVKEGYVEKSAEGYRIVDRKGLELLAEGSK